MINNETNKEVTILIRIKRYNKLTIAGDCLVDCKREGPVMLLLLLYWIGCVIFGFFCGKLLKS